MRCREFQEKHVAFVDDMLSAAETAEMRAHLEGCPACAHRDCAIRRGLLVARNLPRVECSADFGRRLEARLREIGPVNRELPHRASRTFSVAGFSVLAAGIASVAALAAFAMLGTPGAAPVVRVAPVVASVPEPEQDPLVIMPAVVTPVYVASSINGMPVWPAVQAATNASLQMANVQLEQASLSSGDR